MGLAFGSRSPHGDQLTRIALGTWIVEDLHGSSFRDSSTCVWTFLTGFVKNTPI